MRHCKSCGHEALRPETYVDPSGMAEEVRESRMKICLACPSLENHTCKHSGYIISYLASQEDQHCSHPDGSKW